VTAVTLALVIILIGGALIGVYAMTAPRKTRNTQPEPPSAPLLATTDWTSEAGDEFAGLSESARCDLVFAVATLDDERSQQLLEHALQDPAEAVCLAAAHALATNGRRAVVERFLTQHPGERADRITQALVLLE
jgi:hypothetical protein